MALVKMLTLTALGPREEVESIARQLVLREDFQPIPIDTIITESTLRARIGTAGENPCDALLRSLATVWEAAGEPLPEPAPVKLSGEMSLDRIRRDVEGTLKILGKWEKMKIDLQERIRILEAAEILWEALENRSQPLHQLASIERFTVFFGHLQNESASRLDESARDVPLLPLHLTSLKGETWLLAFALPGYAEGAGKLLESLNFRAFSIPEITECFASGGKDRIGHRLASRKHAFERLQNAARRFLRENGQELELLYSRLFTLQRIYDLCRGRGEIGDFYVLSGWIPACSVSGILAYIEDEAPRTAVYTEAPPAGTTGIPTLMRNLPFVRAFQDIVALYSLPGYGESDPSLIVAISFCLMFGFMFGDVGHGLMLVLGAHLLVRKGFMQRSMCLVVQTAGTFSVIFGFLYGSVFGMEDLLSPLWFSPMKDMDLLLEISLGAGVSFITLGMVLNIIGRWRERDYSRMLFDGQGLAGILFYWTTALALFAHFTGRDLPFPGWVLTSVLGLLLAAMIFRSSLARFLPGQVADSESRVVQFFEVFHVLLSFLGNTASFVRLAAFTLNHIGLSLAVFMLGDMVRGLPGGLLLKLLIVVLGNLLIVALEGLIVFIQTLRLEYYEFFSKFYRGGGNPFNPVRWKKKKAWKRPPWRTKLMESRQAPGRS
ncbi:MAG: V-type ATPase 116kDa subunit family protein [Thermovirgaceae bacterium]|nr:V-type ATPase 116kDa subunit family protein [Thermovirgaceae bacterium]